MRAFIPPSWAAPRSWSCFTRSIGSLQAKGTWPRARSCWRCSRLSDALAARRYLAEQVAVQERGTAATRRIADLARKRYREGVSNYLEVLDAERNLFASEQALIQLRRAQADNLVTLYVALGGGQF